MNRRIVVLALAMLLVVASWAIADQEVTFAFDKSTNDVGGAVTEYLIYRSPASGNYDMTEGKEIATVTADGSATYTATVTLPDGYSFVVVTAVGSGGESEPSNEVRCFLRQGTSRKTDPDIAPPFDVSVSQ